MALDPEVSRQILTALKWTLFVSGAFLIGWLIKKLFKRIEAWMEQRLSSPLPSTYRKDRDLVNADPAFKRFLIKASVVESLLIFIGPAAWYAWFTNWAGALSSVSFTLVFLNLVFSLGPAWFLVRTLIIAYGTMQGHPPGVIWRNECVLGEDRYTIIPESSVSLWNVLIGIGFSIVFVVIAVALR